ncbi:DUF4376 domain-containing protein [Desulfovibrio litoralis]|uniref:DUF4376 domain-containing protein n=1 Tax=Desulfovibrio litoralis DSM 11393 TaxID=1121455 RepID=A0A1M7T882_9BACT|nr:DUF4376 domain-containing protein [Desulfovibrio litoralis]SHN66906.1 protein of unknown function [Desulfovibrio litoralis DSM 11393]
MNITVIPSDKIIIVDGEALYFDYKANPNVHAIQYADGKGWIEFKNKPNEPIETEEEYKNDVEEFLILWQAEKARINEELAKLEAERNKPLTLLEARNKAYDLIKQARDNRMNNGGIVWNDYLVSCDEEALNKIAQTTLQFITKRIVSKEWKMSDGEYAFLDENLFFEMATAVGMLVDACYIVEKEKRKTIEQYGTAEEILNWLNDSKNLHDGYPSDGAE